MDTNLTFAYDRRHTLSDSSVYRNPTPDVLRKFDRNGDGRVTLGEVKDTVDRDVERGVGSAQQLDELKQTLARASQCRNTRPLLVKPSRFELGVKAPEKVGAAIGGVAGIVAGVGIAGLIAPGPALGIVGALVGGTLGILAMIGLIYFVESVIETLTTTRSPDEEQDFANRQAGSKIELIAMRKDTLTSGAAPVSTLAGLAPPAQP